MEEKGSEAVGGAEAGGGVPMKWLVICCRSSAPNAIGEFTGRECLNRDGEICPTIGWPTGVPMVYAIGHSTHDAVGAGA